MFMIFNPIAAAAKAQEDQRVQDAAYYRATLHAMIDLGMALLTQQQAARGDAAPVGGLASAAEADPSIAYDRITRSMRRSILLAQKLDEPAVAQSVGYRQAARGRIIRAVEDAIQRDADGDAAEALQAELLERLDGPELEEAIADRPVDEIIAEICRDLGLAAMPGTHPWKRRTPGDVAVLWARAAGRDVVGRPAGALRRAGEAGCRGP